MLLFTQWCSWVCQHEVQAQGASYRDIQKMTTQTCAAGTCCLHHAPHGVLHDCNLCTSCAVQIAFYAYGSYFIDKTGWQGFKTKIEKDFIPTYCAELAIWPAFQVRL